MKLYELTNIQRKYFGLAVVPTNWDKVFLDDNTFVYFDDEMIVKVIYYNSGYLEYDTALLTKNRSILLPKTSRGKEQKLTGSSVLKIKGSAVQFLGSFLGGGISVYDNRRNVSFINSYSEEGDITSCHDMEKWISNYISNASTNYSDWLDQELALKRQRVNVSAGDIIAFRISQNEFGFAHVLTGANGLHKSVAVAPYAFYSKELHTNINQLASCQILSVFWMFDLEIYRGSMPIIGNVPVSEVEKQMIPVNNQIFLTIPFRKKDIEVSLSKHLLR